MLISCFTGFVNLTAVFLLGATRSPYKPVSRRLLFFNVYVKCPPGLSYFGVLILFYFVNAEIQKSRANGYG